MAVTIKVNGGSGGLTLCHKGSNGISTATIPDVCKTPSPGGPVPIPYPNVAKSSDLAKGTTTVKADGGNMCANHGSEFSRSTGDEAGTAGGVTSGTFIKEATWITYSFDVKLEGKGACRLTDKMFHNHQNTVNIGGLAQESLDPMQPEDVCTKLAREIDEMINRDKHQNGGGGTHGLKHRFREQINGANGPPGSGYGDPGVWETHDRTIKDQQRGLRNRLDEFNRNNCGEKVPIPLDAWEWATKPAPTPGQWVEPAVPMAMPSPEPGLMKRMSEITGLTGCALVIYLILSEGSRIFPPRNAIPIP